MKKIKLLIITGGQSSEHEVSLMSAKNVVKASMPSKYDLKIILISKSGAWNFITKDDLLTGRYKKIESHKNPVIIDPSSGIFVKEHKNSTLKFKPDVVFPVMHGTTGEDGSIQGLLKMMNVPCVGPTVLGSAIGMDKDVSKRLLRQSGINVAKFMVLRRGVNVSWLKVMKNLGRVVFIKPASNGSSVGVNKATNEREYKRGVQEAFKYDYKILVEEEIDGREIELSVLGPNHKPQVSIPGEIILGDSFYSYDEKYSQTSSAKTLIPAQKVSKRLLKEMQEVAVKSYQALEMSGMARVDLFYTRAGKILVNELNTIPGFTSISMYPKLWEASGLSYSRLIDRLVVLAINENHSITIKPENDF